jgi:filamentous hemagglutinin
MNRQMHRLIFSRHLGMPVAVAENARCDGKAASAPRRRTGAALAWTSITALALTAGNAWAQSRPPVVFAGKLPAPAQPLPVPYGKTFLSNGSPVNTTPRPFAYNPAQGVSSADLATIGAVGWSVQGKTATFDQGNIDRVVLNWDSFDIGAGYRVHFKQNQDPSKYVSALNRIWSADPSVILGSLSADREVILLNANGVYFGRGARVDTGKFVATSLAIADSVFDKGLRNVTDGSSVFTSAGTDYLATNLSSAVTVEAGAELRSAAGGDVLLFAPRVTNQGRIETPGGQTVLAAGDKVYLMSSSDPKQRGLIVAVDPVKMAGGNDNDTTLGIVENAASGNYKTINGTTVDDNTPDATAGLVRRINEIRADSGTVNLVGLTVRQNGTVNATTAVKGANGAIYLQAMASTATVQAGATNVFGSAGARGLTIESNAQVRVGAQLGTVEIGAGSVTAIAPDTSASTQLDAEVFNPSRIEVQGRTISVGSGALISAPAGNISLKAAADSIGNPLFDTSATILSSQTDASHIVIAPGASITAAGLADVQIDGARNQGSQRLFSIELADAPVQRDGPLYRQEVYFDMRDGSKVTVANVRGAAAAVPRTASELSSRGGEVSIATDGALLLGEDASVDVSGGSVHYSQAILKKSLVVRNGQVMAFSTAEPGNTIDDLLTIVQQSTVPAYSEGHDGGALTLIGRQLALDGKVRGQVIQGERQRDGTSPRAAPSSLTLGRSIGTQNYIDDIRLDASRGAPVDPSLHASAASGALDSMKNGVVLALSAVGDGGFGALRLRADAIRQSEYGSLNLGAGGTLDAVAANTLALNGAFLAPGGLISLQTLIADTDSAISGRGDIRLSGAAVLSTAGLWTNDTPVAARGNSAAAAPVQRDAGSITLKAANAVHIDAGAMLDVSGGAWLTNTGSLKAGTAGAISLSTGILNNIGTAAGPSLAMDGAILSGFDFAKGGTLTLGAPDLTIGGGPTSGFTLPTAFFSEHGFGSVTINTQGDIAVPGGVHLAPVLSNWLLSAPYRSAPSGAMTAGIATAVALDPQFAERAPVNLTLNASRDLLFGGASVHVDPGAGITLEPGGSLTLAATRNIRVGTGAAQPGQTADLTAQGGNITLAINGVRGGDNDPASDSVGFLGEQSIWLGDAARLSVAGTAVLRPDASAPMFGVGVPGSSSNAPRMTGKVLAGGNIHLMAQRGYVIAESGSSMTLDGVAAQRHQAGRVAPVTVAMPAGTLTVDTPEGFVLDGQVSAHAPTDAAGRPLADGGTLSISVGLGGTQTGTNAPQKYPDDPANGNAGGRTVVVGDFDGLLAARGTTVGQDLSQTLGNGIGYTRASLLQGAGFASLSLGAGGSIRFDTSLTLDLPVGIVLNAPALAAAADAQVVLRTSSAQLGDAFAGRNGNSVPDRSAHVDTSPTGSTQLSVTAPLISLVGSWGLHGFSNVLLDAGGSRDGEVRLSSATLGQSQDTLAFGGRLELAATQVYATNGVHYAFDGTDAAGAGDPGSTWVVRTGSAGAAGTTPLSAFGTLRAHATRIEQRGVIQQPFGSIVLDAERELVLGDGSLTSVSGNGATLPYGQTNNLTAWNLPGGANGTGLPVSKTVQLSGASIQTAATAKVSASGGGAVQAWEFFPGVGGSKDYFETPGLYAVLPDYAAAQLLQTGAGKQDVLAKASQLVVTMAGSGLAPGVYALLPARYALIGGSLPQGAFIVSRATDQGGISLSIPLHQDDGSTIVTGYLRAPGSINTGVPGERFLIEPASTYLAKSDIRQTDIGTLLGGNAATLGATSAPALPRDAGLVQIGVTGNDGAIWQAQVDLRANGGLAGQLDMSATRLALVDDTAKTPQGSLGVQASVIGDSGAGSVLLGGRRSLTSAGVDGAAPTWTLDQGTTTAVTVDIGRSQLQVEELLLAATDSITLAPGTHVNASAAPTLGARTLASVGDGALLAVSANPLQLTRSGATLLGGNLLLGSASVLTGQQVALDASGLLQADSSIRLQAQALDLGARRLVLGQGAAPDGLASNLTGELLAGIRASDTLRLRGYERIDFVGAQDWALRAANDAANANPAPTRVGSLLVLDAPVIRGLDATDGTAAHTDIAAQTVVLRNSSGTLADPGLPGQGSLVLQAVPPMQFGTTGGLIVGPGTLALGFHDADLRSSGDIILQGQGGMTAQGNLNLASARLTAANGAQQSIGALGDLVLATEPGSHTLDERVGQGASVQLSARTVQQRGWIDLAGGSLSVQASGTDVDGTAIRFDAGSTTSVAGFAVGGADSFEAFGHAGSIHARAATGRIALLGTLDASAAQRSDGSVGEGDAGRIRLEASGSGGELLLEQMQADGSIARGTLRAHAGSGDKDLGGRLEVDVQSMALADGLALRAMQGGISREIQLRVRSGNVALNEDIRAQRIALSVDAGALSITDAVLDAHADAGGVVQLAASADLVLQGISRIDARSTRTGANGGDVLLSSTGGQVRIGADAGIDSRGDDAQDGRIVLRAQRGADNASVKVAPLDTRNLLGGEVDIEAVRSYSTVTVGGVTRNIAAIAGGNSTIAGSGSSSTGTLGQGTVRNDSATFMTAQASMLGALGVSVQDSERVHLRAGVEVLAGGNLTINGDWQLANDRPGTDAGFLTLRAAGDLLLNGSISDGFSTATSTGVLNNNARSWSYRLAAGADLSAANPLAVMDLGASSANSGDLTVSGGRIVRTGAGSIEMAAGRDIVFAAGAGSAAQGMAYVAGRKASDLGEVLSGVFSGQSAKPIFTEQGGRLAVQAGRDIVSAESRQLINNWLWRSGIPTGDEYSNSSQLGWWTEFSRFGQTLGSFGGGNLVAEAGRDIVNLQAVAPTAGWADSKTIALAQLRVRNGGDLTVTAGRDVLGGQFLVGEGIGRLNAEGAIGAASGNVRAQNPLLALMDGAWSVSGRTDVTVGSVFNPTAAPVSSSDNRSVFSPFFYTWDGRGGIDVNSNAGAVHVYNELDTGSDLQRFGLNTSGIALPQNLLQVLPASLRITAAGGDVALFTDGLSNAILFPSTSGAFEVWSGGTLTLGSTIAMADSDPALWPDYARPVRGSTYGALIGTGDNGLLPATLAHTLSGNSLHSGDAIPVRLHADASIVAADAARAATLVLPKRAEITSGQDILGLQLEGQNLHASDTTRIAAGRNLLAGLYGNISLAGPGVLDVRAGRQVDLESSGGIQTTGNLGNATLAAQGASIRVAASTSGTLDLPAFASLYLRDAVDGGSPRAAQYRAMLLAYVRTALARPELEYAQAWAAFQQFPSQAQTGLGRQVLAAEFGAIYLSAPAPTSAQMTQSLQSAFAQHQDEILRAGSAALAAGKSLTLPGRTALQGGELAAFLAELGSLQFSRLDIAGIVAARVANLSQIRQGWRDTVAAHIGSSAAAFDLLATTQPSDPTLQAYQRALNDFSGPLFQDYQALVLASETASAGAAASQFGLKSLPMRLALFDQGFQAAELTGAGSFVAQPIWPGIAPVFGYAGALSMTQSSVVTQRGGDISLVNAGGAINIGLKQISGSAGDAAAGVIALGNGDVSGYAKGDFQVNTQRVFVVGNGDMNIWSSSGDIDSGRGANTAVAAPPLVARRSIDGVVFELPATTTGSGLGILEDAAGNRSGTIGLYPAFGEILALDAFIRAPSVVLGSSVKGADNLQAASVGGAAAPVSAPPLAVAAPASTESRNAETQGRQPTPQERTRSALLTVELLGLGPAAGEEECSEQQQSEGQCTKASTSCSAADKAGGLCQ